MAKTDKNINGFTSEEISMLKGKTAFHKMPYTEKAVPIEVVIIHPEWQPRLNTDENRFFNDISLNGLATPPKVWLDDEGKYHALDGRHRWASLRKIQNERPDVWNHHGFNNGVPCKVYENLTNEQVLDLRTDEGRGQQPLNGKVEGWRALKPHFESGKTDKEIEAKYWPIIAETCSSPSKNAELIQSFNDCKDEREFLDKVHNALYGHIMFFRALYNCPAMVEKNWSMVELGNTQDDEGNVFIKFTQGEIRKLASAHKADLAADEASGFELNITKDNPGEIFKMELNKIIDSKKDKDSSPKDKPMDKKERENRMANAKSATEKIIFSAINGNLQSQAKLDDTFERIAKLDKAMQIHYDFVMELADLLIERKEKLDDKDRQQIFAIVSGIKVNAKKTSKK